jgi:hypothetical protein
VGVTDEVELVTGEVVGDGAVVVVTGGLFGGGCGCLCDSLPEKCIAV